jgi:hypothetical protein
MKKRRNVKHERALRDLAAGEGIELTVPVLVNPSPSTRLPRHVSFQA